jgi:N-acetylgalactosamine kinase
MATVPVVKSLDQVYTDVKLQETRYKNISSQFEKEFGTTPQYFARAPGRVNLIGEHVDYSGYGVLPMALEKDVVVASHLKLVEPQSEHVLRLHIASTHPDIYTRKTVSIPITGNNPSSLFDQLHIDINAHHWSSYVLCGVKGILQYIKDHNITRFRDSTQDNKTLELYLLLDGNVPSGSGLSSSSAVVCSAALAMSYALALQTIITKAEMGSLTAKSEQFIGVQSGGMDQAISFLGERNKAMYITFEPKLNAEPVKLPEDVAFVVAHSLAISQKAQTAAYNYNRRVVECRLACVLLARQLLENKPILEGPKTLKWLQDTLGASFETMEKACDEYLRKEPYTMQSVAEELGLESVQALQQRYFPTVQLANQNDLKLHDRALHVFTEAHRTILVEELCNKSQEKDKEHKIGDLMDKSHFSGRDLYEASCPELEELTKLCRSTKGCLGSRFTGAGWGGCTVSCVLLADLNNFLETVWDAYYAKREDKPDRDHVLFASLPATGAAVLVVNDK